MQGSHAFVDRALMQVLTCVCISLIQGSRHILAHIMQGCHVAMSRSCHVWLYMPAQAPVGFPFPAAARMYRADTNSEKSVTEFIYCVKVTIECVFENVFLRICSSLMADVRRWNRCCFSSSAACRAGFGV